MQRIAVNYTTAVPVLVYRVPRFLWDDLPYEQLDAKWQKSPFLGEKKTGVEADLANQLRNVRITFKRECGKSIPSFCEIFGCQVSFFYFRMEFIIACHTTLLLISTQKGRLLRACY